MIFVLEAKKIEKTQLSEHLPQLCDYLRRLCLDYNYSSLCGALTNYKTWIFVKYDLMGEVAGVHRKDANEVAAHFEVCREITLLDERLKPRSTDFTAKLAHILEAIHMCCTLLP